MSTEQLQALVIEALEDIKATDIRVLDLRGRSGFTDIMIIASGNTDRQVKALAGNVVTRAKENGVRPLGVEGERQGEWVLVDLGEVVVHVMQPSVRDFYNMEKLWGEESPKQRQE
ncbi:MAG: ribosome silencing factor [Pseudomonadota bacterium]|nr:MAG: ribosome silencing factor [Pseudomonadota bacterium]